MTDPRAQNIVRLITESIQVEHLRFLFALPPLRYIFPEQTGWNKQKEVIEETSALMRDIVTQHKETFDEDNLRDFVDVYLKEMMSTPDVSFTEEQLLVTAMDLFSAGSETTATTLAWAVCFMITHPEIQVRVQAEIGSGIGLRASRTEASSASPRPSLWRYRGWPSSPQWPSPTAPSLTSTSAATKYPRTLRYSPSSITS